MNVAILCSNNDNMDKDTANGTAVFNHSLITELANYQGSPHHYTAFASGESDLPIPIQSVATAPSSADSELVRRGKVIMYELALISKAFSNQDDFDLFHINIGDGDLSMPFTPFVKKPILITLHHIYDNDFTRNYFDIFKNQKNVFFISISDRQRRILPGLQYLKTIYHGLNTTEFSFDARGGEQIMWAGRLIPEKGPDQVVQIALKLNKKATLFGIPREEYRDWLKENVLAPTNDRSDISLVPGLSRAELIPHFQCSKLFLLPIKMEEPFGFVFIEAMSCGTPVVAYARGSVPEVIKDGVTGFIVNESDDDIRGDWIIKKTGIEGLKEAVQRIYDLSEEEYVTMRKNCREHVVSNFDIETMGKNYIQAYEDLVTRYNA